MGNGNKIKIKRPEVKLFLHEDLLPSEAETPSLYSLEKEYAKTRKRKFSFILSVLLGCFTGVALLTYGLATYLQTRNATMEVDIKVFEDLNLKNLLDVVSQTQASLEQASSDKNQLEIELSTKIKQAQVEKDTYLQLLESLKMGNEEKQREIRAINTDYERMVKELEVEYAPQIAMYESKMEDYTKQLASYDSANVALAQQQESAINSQRQIFELEKQELTKSYEKLVADLVDELELAHSSQLQAQRETVSALSSQYDKELMALDPIFTDNRAFSIIDRFVISTPVLENSFFSPNGKTEFYEQSESEALQEGNNLREDMKNFTEEIIPEESISKAAENLATITQEGFELQDNLEIDDSTLFSIHNFNLQLEDQGLQKKAEESLFAVGEEFNDFNYLAEIISTVPWQNSLKKFFETISSMVNKIGNDIVNATIELLQIQEKTIQEKNTIINDNKILISALEAKAGSAEKVIAVQTQTLEKRDQALAQREAELKEVRKLVEALRLENDEQMIFVEEMRAQIDPLLAIKENHDYLLNSFDDRARENGDFGYVLHVDKSTKIGVYISPLYKEIIKDGMKAYVFRTSEMLIGEITLHKENDSVYAMAEEDVKESLRSNDVILLELVR